MIGAYFIGRLARSLRDAAQSLRGDERGIAATEFAVIVPLLLTMFFGVVEMTSGVAVDRKVTLVARTLSDLTSQSVSVTDDDITNFRNASSLIMWPYAAGPINSTISELYVNPAATKATVQWSKGSAARGTGTQVTIPSALLVADSYLIYSEVNYLYVPAVGYIMSKLGVTLSDATFTRPRQNKCVLYNTTSGACPTS